MVKCFEVVIKIRLYIGIKMIISFLNTLLKHRDVFEVPVPLLQASLVSTFVPS
jgi:hypothetical protein